MVRLAFRNLFQNRLRLLLSTGGLALALLLILALDAIFAGLNRQVAAYIDHSGADVWVAQSGVRNMHMASSTMPAAVAQQVSQVAGVASVTPIDYFTGGLDIGRQSHIVYVIGLPPAPSAGTPWTVVAGRSVPRDGEVVIDKTVADAEQIGIGSDAYILNQRFRVAGLTRGTLTIVNSIAFITNHDFKLIRRTPGTVSYLLVKASSGTTTSALAASINRQVPDVTAIGTAQFAAEERSALATMVTDLVNIMNIVGLLIGLAVMALSVYTATLARRSEYGVLKAVGARNRDLYLAVIGQAAISVLLALGLSAALTAVLVLVVPAIRPGLDMQMSVVSLAKVAGMAFAITAVAAALPIRQIAGLDPSVVFRRRIA